MALRCRKLKNASMDAKMYDNSPPFYCITVHEMRARSRWTSLDVSLWSQMVYYTAARARDTLIDTDMLLTGKQTGK